MPHYRKMYDSEYLASWDLDGDTTITISKVVGGEVGGHAGGKKERRPLVFFEGAKKAMVLNKTNGKIISAMYGPKTEDWEGKKITLFVSECDSFGEMTPCLRVRPAVPK